MTGPVRSEAHNFVRTITLDHAPGNITDAALMVKLLEIVPLANHDWDTRVVVIESALPRVFSLGDDHAAPRPLPSEPRDSFGVPSTHDALIRHFLRGIWDMKWPVIAKVEGTAMGTGLLLAALAGANEEGATIAAHHVVLRRVLAELPVIFLSHKEAFHVVDHRALRDWKLFYSLRPLIEDAWLVAS